jgi:hypothetical protein
LLPCHQCCSPHSSADPMLPTTIYPLLRLQIKHIVRFGVLWAWHRAVTDVCTDHAAVPQDHSLNSQCCICLCYLTTLWNVKMYCASDR